MKKEKFVSGEACFLLASSAGCLSVEFPITVTLPTQHQLLRYAGIAVQHFLACTRELFGAVRIYTD